MNPLLDNDFLIKLINDRNRIIYARIISLNQYEHPIEQIEGLVTGGTISIDGSSAVRRTCSLTLSAKDLNINNVYWGLSTKIKIELGIQNNILDYQYYDKIIWFDQGLFVLTDFKTTQSINNYTINIAGKDKMCLLNGDVSGNIPAPTVFDSYADRSGQEYTLPNGVTEYNNFADVLASTKALEGFTERYGSDYSYIRGVQKIISLQYKPVQPIENKEELKAVIKFAAGEEEQPLKNLLSDQPNKKGFYDINLDQKTISGFIVQYCSPGDKFSWEIDQKIPIVILIQELLHQYGQEKYSNIIIKDIEPYALEMLDNNTAETIYLLHDGVSYVKSVTQETLIKDYRLYFNTMASDASNTINFNKYSKKITDFIFRQQGVGEDNTSLVTPVNGGTTSQVKLKPTQIVKLGEANKPYTVLKIEPMETIGYGMTLLVYPDELKANVGDSITSILDKIVNMLGNYEYFYNLKGQFVFQKKPAYIQPQWNNSFSLKDNNYIHPSELVNRVTYTFDDATLTTQYQNSPNLNNIKNDYIIWGERNKQNGTEKFHGRYAISSIPLEYTDFNGYTWTASRLQVFTPTQEELEQNPTKFINANGITRQYALQEDVDWRQLISLMANDWYQHHIEDDYEIILRENNCWPGLNIDLYPSGRTNYEQFYLDLSTVGGFWDQLYNVHLLQYQYLQEHPQLMDDLYKEDGSFNTQSEAFPIIANFDTDAYQLYYRKSIGDELKAHIIDIDKKENEITGCVDLQIIVSKEESQKNIEEEILFFMDKGIFSSEWKTVRDIIAEDIFSLLSNIRFIKSTITNDKVMTKRYEDSVQQYGENSEESQWAYKNMMQFKLTEEVKKDNAKKLDECMNYINELCYIINKVKIFNNEVLVNGLNNLPNFSLLDVYDENFNFDEIINILSDLEVEIGKITKQINNKEIYGEYYLLKLSIMVDYLPQTYDIHSFIRQFIEQPELKNIELISEIGLLEARVSIDKKQSVYFQDGEYKYWHRNVIENPELLNFWFDFFNADKMGIGKYAINVIGDRPKTINDTSIKTIIYRDTPDVIYCDWIEYYTYLNSAVLKDGYQYIILDNNGDGHMPEEIVDLLRLYEDYQRSTKISERKIIRQKFIDLGYTDLTLIKEYYNKFSAGMKQENFIRSVRGKNVHSQAEEMLNQYSYYNDNVNLTGVPIYYLQPNTIISIKDELSHIIGYYIMNKINFSLAYNGTMSITAIKSPEQIY